MSLIDIGFIGVLASLIILCAFQIINIERLTSDIKIIIRRLNAIDEKIERHKENTDRRIVRINRIMDSNIGDLND
jgi:uncharacterized protein YoxC